MVLRRLIDALDRPVDAASTALYRCLFGALMVALATRFFTHAWIRAEYETPTHFFHYWGFEWLRPLPAPWMHVLFAIMALSAACVAVGIAYRPACVVFAMAFTYAHLADKSNYLNHYYLVSLIASLMAVLPLDREGSVRVVLRPGDRRPAMRSWILWLLRFQIAVVYVFGGLAKIGVDWLVHGEPLRIWLSANAELPVIGRLAQWRGAGVLFGWAGMVFDLSVVPLLLWRRSRYVAMAGVLVFHTLTSVLFHIGMFPWIMSTSATLFLDPSWPRRMPWPRRLRAWATAPHAPLTREVVAGSPLSSARAALLAAYAIVQVLVPLRHVLYPGNTLWTEEGFRFAWRVMLIEKSGELELTVVDASGQRTSVSPRAYLTALQARMASTQPDMILELAHIVARDFEARTGRKVRVYADAQVSFNGRPPAPLVDPTKDLAAEEDHLAPSRWILPAPTSIPEL